MKILRNIYGGLVNMWQIMNTPDAIAIGMLGAMSLVAILPVALH